MMDTPDSVRAWKDPDQRSSTSGAENPAGEIDLSEARAGLEQEARTEYIASLGCCQGFTTSPYPPCVTLGPFGSACGPVKEA